MIKQTMMIFLINKKLLILFIFLLISSFGFTQTRPSFVPDQIEDSRQLHIKCYCKPGLSSQSRPRGLELVYQYQNARIYGNSQGMPISQTPAEVNSSQLLSGNIKIPIINHEQFKFLIGFKHSQEIYNLSSFGQNYEDVFNKFDNAIFKHSAIGVIFSHSYNEFNYISFRARLIANGNYNGLMNFGKKYGYYNLIGFWGRKKTETLEWGVGLRYGQNLQGQSRLIPFVMYNRNFSDKWGIESVLPAFVFLRYNPNKHTILFGGVELESQNFVLDLEENTAPDTPDYIFDYSSFLLTTSIEKKIIDWIWYEVKAGYVIPFNSRFDSIELPAFEVNPSNYFTFKISFFISPPDEFLK